MKLLALIIITVLFAAGCADWDFPTPQKVINKPLGTESVKIGMSKDKVRNIWGDPDFVDYEEKDIDGSERRREVWTYKARYSAVPVDAGYLSKTKHLYFDGNSLTQISNTE